MSPNAGEASEECRTPLVRGDKARGKLTHADQKEAIKGLESPLFPSILTRFLCGQALGKFLSI
jgi:hypothetical protein